VQLGALLLADAALVGFVTSGHFALAAGRAHAIGALSPARIVQLVQQAQRLDGPNALAPLVKVRDRDGVVCRAARVYVLEE
jgi:ribonuclease P/MRP protein subunit POP1